MRKALKQRQQQQQNLKNSDRPRTSVARPRLGAATASNAAAAASAAASPYSLSPALGLQVDSSASAPSIAWAAARARAFMSTERDASYLSAKHASRPGMATSPSPSSEKGKGEAEAEEARSAAERGNSSLVGPEAASATLLISDSPSGVESAAGEDGKHVVERQPAEKQPCGSEGPQPQQLQDVRRDRRGAGVRQREVLVVGQRVGGRDGQREDERGGVRGPQRRFGHALALLVEEQTLGQ